MDILIESKKFPDTALLLLDSKGNSTEELLDAITEAKEDCPWINMNGCTIRLQPAKLIVTID
jgi:hypothetical protein